MDQNSSNGSGADKRNWRERLGIGGKDMPKISDEFKTAPPPEPVETDLTVSEVPIANTQRYDSLREEVSDA